jgi:hypothetical protein
MFGDIVSGVLGYLGTKDTNDTNQEIAQANNAWSAAQYASRYQTMTTDMQKAGLNPMLAYSQSAGQSPTAQQVQFQNPMASALEGYHRSKERDVMSAQVNNILADTKVKDETAKQIVAATEKAKADERLATSSANEATVRMASQLNYGNPTQKALAASYWSQIDVNKANLPKIASEIASNGAYAAQARAQAEKAIAESKITRADLDRALNDQRYERVTGGTIRQTARDLGNITGAAVNARKAGMTKR